MKNFKANCNKCNWKGSEFKLLYSLNGINCPKCNSSDVVLFGEPQTKTIKDQILDFAHYYRNGITNMEYCEKSIEFHLEDFLKKVSTKNAHTDKTAPTK